MMTGLRPTALLTRALLLVTLFLALHTTTNAKDKPFFPVMPEVRLEVGDEVTSGMVPLIVTYSVDDCSQLSAKIEYRIKNTGGWQNMSQLYGTNSAGMIGLNNCDEEVLLWDIGAELDYPSKKTTLEVKIEAVEDNENQDFIPFVTQYAIIHVEFNKSNFQTKLLGCESVPGDVEFYYNSFITKNRSAPGFPIIAGFDTFEIPFSNFYAERIVPCLDPHFCSSFGAGTFTRDVSLFNLTRKEYKGYQSEDKFKNIEYEGRRWDDLKTYKAGNFPLYFRLYDQCYQLAVDANPNRVMITTESPHFTQFDDKVFIKNTLTNQYVFLSTLRYDEQTRIIEKVERGLHIPSIEVRPKDNMVFYETKIGAYNCTPNNPIRTVECYGPWYQIDKLKETRLNLSQSSLNYSFQFDSAELRKLYEDKFRGYYRNILEYDSSWQGYLHSPDFPSNFQSVALEGTLYLVDVKKWIHPRIASVSNPVEVGLEFSEVEFKMDSLDDNSIKIVDRSNPDYFRLYNDPTEITIVSTPTNKISVEWDGLVYLNGNTNSTGRSIGCNYEIVATVAFEDWEEINDNRILSTKVIEFRESEWLGLDSIESEYSIETVKFEGAEKIEINADPGDDGSKGYPDYVAPGVPEFSMDRIRDGFAPSTVGYKQGSVMSLKGTLCSSVVPSHSTVVIKAYADIDGNRIDFQEVTFDPSSEFTLVAQQPLPNKILYIENLKIQFEVDSGEGFKAAGNSTNEMYIARDRISPTVYHTVMDIGVRNASGIPVDANLNDSDQIKKQIVDSIFKEFEDLCVSVVRDRKSGYCMGDYQDQSISGTGTNYDYIQLLKEKDSQCTAWNQLLEQVTRHQGISVPSHYAGVLPATISSYRYLTGSPLLTTSITCNNTVTLNATLSISDSIIYGVTPQISFHNQFIENLYLSNYAWFNFSVDKDLYGQGKDRAGSKPNKYEFNFHSINLYEKTIYDPSYGTKFSKTIDFQNTAQLKYHNLSLQKSILLRPPSSVLISGRTTYISGMYLIERTGNDVSCSTTEIELLFYPKIDIYSPVNTCID
ncbi:MAG: hypothetical protein SFY68_14145 [Candidatus Sumerlaeia bacterium]|nr:hypothetical protein [Candidatus Sumerlaeia bacterium]